VAQNANPKPTLGKGQKKCDGCFEVAGSTVYLEAKRYEDPWPSLTGSTPRSIAEKPEDKAVGATRPRSMVLFSKLRAESIPDKFPVGTVNLLFLFHPSLGETQRYVQSALYGESNFFLPPAGSDSTLTDLSSP
jgi:hypothetical protein